MPSPPPRKILLAFSKTQITIIILSVFALVMGSYLLRYRSLLKSTARTTLVLDSRFNSLATQVAATGLQARAATQELASINRQIEALSQRIDGSTTSRILILDSRFNSLATQVETSGLEARAATQGLASTDRQIEALAQRIDGSTASRMLILESRFNSLATQVEAGSLESRSAVQGLASTERRIEALAQKIETSDSHRMRAVEDKLVSIQGSIRHMSGVYVPLLLVGDGNSLMFGSGGATPFLQQTSDILGLPIINRGVRGQSIQDMIDDAATDIDPLLQAEGVRPVLIVWEGLNWMRVTGNKTAADYVDRLEEYCRARRAAGWKHIVVVNSASHNWPSGSWKPGKTAGEINDEIKMRWRGFADAMLDVSWLKDPSALDLYQPDQIHLTTRAQARIARDLIALLPDLQNGAAAVPSPSALPTPFRGEPRVSPVLRTPGGPR